MGTIITNFCKYFNDSLSHHSHFHQQQSKQYSFQLSCQCLKHLQSSTDKSFTSLKKVYCFLHPAIKLILSSSNQEEIQNIIQQSENSLIHSSVNVARMYLNLIEKIVPASIMDIHFMREKDLYSHYICIRYILECGHLNSSLDDCRHIFKLLSLQEQGRMLKTYTRWLYDMVKYYGSAIYISSQTLPHLINLLYTFVTGILQNGFAWECTHSKKQELLEQLLYLSTFFLCKSNHQANYSMIQVVCGCLSTIYDSMMNSFSQGVYTQSCWYAQQIGYVREPFLQKVCIRVIMDLLSQKNGKQNQTHNLEDYDECSVFQQKQQSGPLNPLSKIYLLHTLHQILKNSNKFHYLPELHHFLYNFVRNKSDPITLAFILDILAFIEVPPSLISLRRHYQQHQQLYSKNNQIGWKKVRRNCSMYVESLIPMNVKKYNTQLVKEEGQLWEEVERLRID